MSSAVSYLRCSTSSSSAIPCSCGLRSTTSVTIPDDELSYYLTCGYSVVDGQQARSRVVQVRHVVDGKAREGRLPHVADQCPAANETTDLEPGQVSARDASTEYTLSLNPLPGIAFIRLWSTTIASRTTTTCTAWRRTSSSCRTSTQRAEDQRKGLASTTHTRHACIVALLAYSLTRLSGLHDQGLGLVSPSVRSTIFRLQCICLMKVQTGMLLSRRRHRRSVHVSGSAGEATRRPFARGGRRDRRA